MYFSGTNRDCTGRANPIAYQHANGTRQEVSASYIPQGLSGIGFQLGDCEEQSWWCGVKSRYYGQVGENGEPAEMPAGVRSPRNVSSAHASKGSLSERVNFLSVGNIAHGDCGVLLIFNHFFWVFGLRAGLIGWGIPVAQLKLLSDDAPTTSLPSPVA
jgi:hypothetical protein